jgi:hypothetical protein
MRFCDGQSVTLRRRRGLSRSMMRGRKCGIGEKIGWLLCSLVVMVHLQEDPNVSQMLKRTRFVDQPKTLTK